jgi:hypothetical protein
VWCGALRLVPGVETTPPTSLSPSSTAPQERAVDRVWRWAYQQFRTRTGSGAAGVHTAWEDGGIVGAAGSFPFDLTVPGDRVFAA